MNKLYLRQKNVLRFRSGPKNHVLLFFIFTVLSFSAAAQNYTLTSNGDTPAASPSTSPNDAGGQITLRSAIQAATAIAGTHIITIPASITSINLTLGQITVGNSGAGNNITINGPGKAVLTVNQTTVNRIFSTGLGAVTFSLNDLTLNYAGPAGSFTGGGGAIIAGGINANTTLTNVAINNFNIQAGNGGAILCSTNNTNNFTLTNCDFTNNTAGGAGGAINYVGLSPSICNITNCTFTNNKTGVVGASTGANGGAISTSGTGSGAVYTITNCTFINNFAVTQGGALSNINGALTANFCRFVGNNAASGKVISQAGGVTVQTVNANNNWWGTNDAPSTSTDIVVLAAGGTITCTKWLQLKLSSAAASLCAGSGTTVTASFLSNSAGEAVTTGNISRLIGLPITFSQALGALSGAQATIQAAGTATVTYTAGTTAGAGTVNGVVDNLPNNDAVARASITALATPAISASPAASTSCAGLAVSFSATVSNQTSVIWQESANAGFSSPTTVTNAGVFSGAGTTTLSISDNTALNGKYYRLIASNANGCPNATSAGALLTATTPTLSANNSVTQNVGVGNNIYYAASCAVICKVAPLAGNPVTGSVTSQVWVEGAVPTVSGRPFVQRHYQVTPAVNQATATATVTLYFSQTEFDNFNAHANSTLNLPTGSGDAAGKANLRVSKYSGNSSGGGLPASYSSTVLVIDPPDANIVWNGAPFNRWEVTVDVTGFSGFFVQTFVFPLPIKLLSFTADYSNNSAKLKWTIAQPEEGSSFELQRSNNAVNFTTINTQQGDLSKTQFNYTDPLTVSGKWYYRLQMTDKNGKVTYSDIVFVRVGSDVQEITIYPNPIRSGEDIKVNLQNMVATKLELSNVAGQQIWTVKENITGSYRIHLPFTIAKGIYMLKVYTGETVETRKIIME